jgi:SRSO17 transposase
MDAAWCGVEWGGAFSTCTPVTALATRECVRRPESERRAGLRPWRGSIRYPHLRRRARILGFDYALGIHATTTMWRLDSQERRRGQAASARDIVRELGPKAFRRVTWREGTAGGKRGKMSSRFAFCRVKVANDDGFDPGTHEPIWLIAEWPEGEKAATKFALTTLKRTMSKKEIVRTFKERYRTELVYEEMKGELGLDHFEGRSFPGWNHHVTVALCCYAFVIGERMQHFPPTAGRQGRARPLEIAA